MKKRQTRRKRTPSSATWAYRAFGGIGLTILLISPMECGPLSPINVIAIIGSLAYAWYCVIRHNAVTTTTTTTTTAAPVVATTKAPVAQLTTTSTTAAPTTTAADKAA